MDRAKPTATGITRLCLENLCSHQRASRQGTTTTESAEWASTDRILRAQGLFAVSCSRRLMVLSKRLKDRRFTGSIIDDPQASGQRASESRFLGFQGELDGLLVRHDLPLGPFFRIAACILSISSLDFLFAFSATRFGVSLRNPTQCLACSQNTSCLPMVPCSSLGHDQSHEHKPGIFPIPKSPEQGQPLLQTPPGTTILSQSG